MVSLRPARRYEEVLTIERELAGVHGPEARKRLSLEYGVQPFQRRVESRLLLRPVDDITIVPRFPCYNCTMVGYAFRRTEHTQKFLVYCDREIEMDGLVYPPPPQTGRLYTNRVDTQKAYTQIGKPCSQITCGRNL